MRRDRSRLSLVGEPNLGPDEDREQCDGQPDQRRSNEKPDEACPLDREAREACEHAARNGECPECDPAVPSEAYEAGGAARASLRGYPRIGRFLPISYDVGRC